MEDLSSSQVAKQYQDMFDKMYKSLKKSKTISQYAVFLFGEIRCGKSTTYNWIAYPQALQGKAGCVNVDYVLTKYEGSIALLNSQFQSVTLVPNTTTIWDGEVQTSLIDLPGLTDSRTCVQVMLVNYVINTCFENSTKVKFIIIISNAQFTNTNGKKFIDTLEQFVKLFKNLGPEERTLIYKSASLVITSAQVTQYDDSKQRHLILLKENIQKARKLKQKKGELQNFEMIWELVGHIISDKRLELFKIAQPDQSPSQSQIISLLNKCGWQYFNLKPHRESIAYPYEEQYQKLSQNDKNHIDGLIKKKIKQFQALQSAMVNTIETYLKNPFNREVDLTGDFLQFETISKRNKVHLGELPEVNNIKGDEQFLNPLNIYQNLNKLLSFQIKLDGLRQQEERKTIHYISYLTDFFKKTIKLFRQSFAIKNQQKEVLAKIHVIFVEIMQQLIYITKINKGISNDCSHYLRQSIQIMNRGKNRQQILKSYIEHLSDQNFEDEYYKYELEELKKWIQFIDQLRGIQFQEKILLKAKILKAEGKVLFNSQQYYKSAQQLILAFENAIKYKLHLIYKSHQTADTNTDKSSSSEAQLQAADKYLYLNTAIQELIEQIIKSLYIASFQLANQESMQIFKNHELLFILQQSLQHVQYKQDKIYYYQLYASFFENNQKYSLAIKFYQKLKCNPQIKKKISKCQEIKHKLNLLKKNHKKQNKSQKVTDIQKLIDLINQINGRILKKQTIFVKSSLQNQMINQRKKQQIIKNQKDQFEYEISSNHSNYELINLCQSLINKIKKRKVVLLFGQKSGKTTAFYWLTKRQMRSINVKKNQYYYELSSNQPNRLHHKLEDTSLIPNIYPFQDGQLLIDFSRLFQNKLFNAIIQLCMLKLILQHSSGVKFIIVIKQENLQKGQVIKILQFMTNAFDWAQDFFINNKSLSLLINYSSSEQTSLEIFNRFLQGFSKQYQNQELLQQVYGVNKKRQNQYKKCLSQINDSKRILFLPKASEKRLNTYNIKKFNQQVKWEYVETSKIGKSHLFHYLKQFSNSQSELTYIKKIIEDCSKSAEDLMRKLGHIFNIAMNKQEYKQNSLFSNKDIDKIAAQEFKQLEKDLQICTFNKILAFSQLLLFLEQKIHLLASSILSLKEIIIQMVSIFKKIRFALKDTFKCVLLIQAKFENEFIVLQKIQQIDCKYVSFGSDLSKIRCMHTCSTKPLWLHHAPEELRKQLIQLISRLDVKALIAENKNPSQYLFKLIEQYQKLWSKKIFNQNSQDLKLLVQKYRQALKTCKELMKKEKKYYQSIKYLSQLFKLNFQYQKDLFEKSKNIQGQQSLIPNKQIQIANDKKIQLVKIIKEIIQAFSQFDEKYAFEFWKFIQCDQVKCNLFEKKLNKQTNQKRLELLPQYLNYLQQIGQEYKFQYLIDQYKEQQWRDKQYFYQLYMKIRNRQLKWESSKKNFYKNIDKIKVEHFQRFLKEINNYLKPAGQQIK